MNMSLNLNTKKIDSGQKSEHAKSNNYMAGLCNDNAEIVNVNIQENYDF